MDTKAQGKTFSVGDINTDPVLGTSDVALGKHEAIKRSILKLGGLRSRSTHQDFPRNEKGKVCVQNWFL